MAFILTSTSGKCLRYDGYAMSTVFQLLDRYGWKPRGTKKPKGYGFFRRWSGAYHTNDGQLVTAPDAANMAAAVQRALSDPDLERHIAAMVERIYKDVGLGCRPTSCEPSVSPSMRMRFEASAHFVPKAHSQFHEHGEIGNGSEFFRRVEACSLLNTITA